MQTLIYRLSGRWFDVLNLMSVLSRTQSLQTHVTKVSKVYLVFQSNSEICYNELSTVAGLNPVMPSGAMYLMVSSQHVLQAYFEYL